MKISYQQLSTFISIEESPEELGKMLTATGLEVEDIERIDALPGGLEGVVVGEVITCVPHPNADKLRLTTVAIGQEDLLSIVCGAPNVAVGQKVIVATVGAILYPLKGESFEIKKSKIRGEVSEGMLCAEDEIGLGESHDGIMVLATDLPNGTPAAQYFDMLPDYCIEIGLTPNRADAASHFGVARDIRALTGKPITLPDVTKFETSSEITAITVTVENTEACPRFCGLEIKGVAVKESPDWLKKFLRTIGLNSINNIVDVTNYINHSLGQPMHVFDADKIEGRKIVVRVPEVGTTVKTLDGQERKLSGSDLAICDAVRPMAIAGVFGGETSGVQATTTNVFLEVAYFHPSWIRRTSTFHSLKTDASFRYERGTDPNMPPFAIKVAALLIQELAGGTILGGTIDNYPAPIGALEIVMKYKNINRLIGKTIAPKEIHAILESLDINILTDNDQEFLVSVPPYRVDVTREADVIEEILRIYGFDNIELSENLRSDFLSDFPTNDADALRNRVAEALAANGFNEIQTLSIVKPSHNVPLKELSKGEEVTLMNPLSEDLSVMRQGLLFSGLEAIAYNNNRRQANLKFFEFGRSYYKITTENGVKYKDNLVLGCWLTGTKSTETWHHGSQKTEFYDIALTVKKILGTMKVKTKPVIADAATAIFEYGLSYNFNKKVVVSFGLVKKSHLKYSDVKQPVFYAEFDWEFLLKNYSSEVAFDEIPKFPEVRRDLSLVLDKAVKYEAIESLAFQTERKLLKNVDVFDVYEGDKLEEGKKSYSVSFQLLDTTQTLTDKVIDKTMARFIQVFETQLGAIIRR